MKHGAEAIDPSLTHGVRTPMDTSGGNVSKTLRWETPSASAHVVTARQRAFADGLARPAALDDPNTTFGVVTAPIGDTVGSLIKTTTTAADADATADLRDRVQAQLRPLGATSIGRLENDLAAAAASNHASPQAGAVPATLVKELCTTYGLGIGSGTLSELLAACSLGGGGGGEGADEAFVDSALCFLLIPSLDFFQLLFESEEPSA
jgi:hypothetical protein